MKMRVWYLLVFAIWPQSSAAQVECPSIDDDITRLSCYDAKYGIVAAEEEAAPASEQIEITVDLGEWDKRVDVSALTDEKNVFLFLQSTNRIPGSYGGSGNGRLWLRCMENTTAVLFDFNDHFMSDIQGYGRVEYRIDDLELASISTSTSTDNKTLGLWRGSAAIPFIKRLLGHDQLIVRATPYNESPMTLTYDIRGIDDAIVELRETCSW